MCSFAALDYSAWAFGAIGFLKFFDTGKEDMQKAMKWIAMGAMLAGAGAVLAQQSAGSAEPQNIVQLSASGSVDVQQDLLVLTLSTTREGKDAASVQTQLRQALDAATLEARRQAEPGQMDVRTGSFGLYPRYGQNSQINGWQGRAELVLEGRDFARITGTAARVSTMTIGNVAFDLSRAQRAQVERDAQGQAIENFKTQATDLTRAFGFGGFTLREVAVNSNSYAPGPRPRMMAMEAKSAMADTPIAVEAGKSTVTVNVSGSVQMR